MINFILCKVFSDLSYLSKGFSFNTTNSDEETGPESPGDLSENILLERKNEYNPLWPSPYLCLLRFSGNDLGFVIVVLTDTQYPRFHICAVNTGNMNELTEMLSYIFMSTYKSLVYFIHSLLVTGETPRGPSAIHVLGNPARLSSRGFQHSSNVFHS